MRILIDKLGGIVRWATSNPGGEVAVHTEHDVSAILRANARDADVDQKGRIFRLVARVPQPIIDQAKREGWVDDKEKWRAWLNDPDNRAFRVWQGRV